MYTLTTTHIEHNKVITIEVGERWRAVDRQSAYTNKQDCHAGIEDHRGGGEDI